MRELLPDAHLLMYFNDQPASDYNTLMDVLVRDEDGSPSYADPQDLPKVNA